MFKKVAFTMYPVTNMARAEHFYRETLGLGPSTGSVERGWIEFDLCRSKHHRPAVVHLQ